MRVSKLASKVVAEAAAQKSGKEEEGLEISSILKLHK